MALFLVGPQGSTIESILSKFGLPPLGLTVIGIGWPFSSLLIPLSAFCFEICIVGYERSTLRKVVVLDRHLLRDLAFNVVPILSVYSSVAFIATFGLSSISMPYSGWISAHALVPQLDFFPLQLAIIPLSVSFFQYWQHRLEHCIPFFWELHKFHHSAETMTVLNGNRDGLFGNAIFGSLIAAPTAIVGAYKMPDQMTVLDATAFVMFFCYNMFTSLNAYLVHSELRATYGWLGRWILVSPINHRVHHSLLPQHQNKNFGATLVLWDRLFKTYHEGADPISQSCPIGLVDNIYNKRNVFIDYFWHPPIGFARVLISSLKNIFALRASKRLGALSTTE